MLSRSFVGKSRAHTPCPSSLSRRVPLSCCNYCVRHACQLAAKGRTEQLYHTSPLPLFINQNAQQVHRQICASLPARRYYSTPTETESGIRVKTVEHPHGCVVATITISNPAKLNIVDSALLSGLTASCLDLSKIDALRAVVLTGADTPQGKAASFIGGADINEMYKLSSSEDAKAFIFRIHAACKALRDLPVPVIARVNGLSLGAGLEIMAACDLRIATKGSLFGMPEVKIGIPSVIEAALLPGLIGMGRTRRLLYLAENIDAEEAERWGLVEKVVDDQVQLNQAVDDWVERIMCMGPNAIRSQKRLMQTWENCTVGEGIQAGVRTFEESYGDGGREPKEFMGRFVNRKQ